VAHPFQFVEDGMFALYRLGGDALKAGPIARRVYGKAVYLDAVEGAAAGRVMIGPGDVIQGAGGDGVNVGPGEEVFGQPAGV
jgi:hypothetical protein